MSSSRNNSQDEATNGSAVGTPLSPNKVLGRLVEPGLFTDRFNTDTCTKPSTAQQSLEDIIENRHDAARPRRTSSLRLFTNRFPRLRRTRTGETSIGAGEASESSSPTATSTLVSPDEADDSLDMNEPTDEAVEAYMKRNAHK